jgi:hypothetical protein
MKEDDPLEKFIRSNRDAFDDKEVPADSWDHIGRSLLIKKKVSLWNNVAIWRAAAVLFLAVSVYLTLPLLKTSNENQTSIKEFHDVESFYAGEISKKVALIDELSEGDSEDEFTQDFKQLEAMYNVLREELKNHPSKQVKDALVLNLLVRINLLNQQLYKLDDGDKQQAEGKEI